MSHHCCTHCQRPLPSLRRNPKQQYCNKSQCQKARKASWQKNKMKTDPAYRENQKRAQNDWQKNHPDYWKTYRDNHQEYTDRNRENTRERMQIKRQVASILNSFAKMDAFPLDCQRLSGYYVLLPLGAMFAKMDAEVSENHCIARKYTPRPRPPCLQREDSMAFSIVAVVAHNHG